MAIVFSFSVLVLLILWFIIGSRGNWWLKALVMVLSLHLSLSIGSSLPDFAGWPSDASVPDKFLVHWIVVKEPDKRTKEEGLIYLWATNLSEEEGIQKEGWGRILFSLETVDRSEPRAYRLPYSTKDHQQADDIVSRIKEGETIIGTKNSKGGEGSGEGEGDGDGSGEGEGSDSGLEGGQNEGNGSGGFSLSDDATFQQLPPPFLPPKD